MNSSENIQMALLIPGLKNFAMLVLQSAITLRKTMTASMILMMIQNTPKLKKKNQTAKYQL